MEQNKAVGKARNSSARWHGNWTSSCQRGSEKLQAALKNVKDFKEGPVAQAIIEAAHKNIGSEDMLAVDKANVCVKTQTMHDTVLSAFYCSIETKKN